MEALASSSYYRRISFDPIRRYLKLSSSKGHRISFDLVERYQAAVKTAEYPLTGSKDIGSPRQSAVKAAEYLLTGQKIPNQKILEAFEALAKQQLLPPNIF